MSYQSENISVIVARLNVRYLLPAIQREFVWKPEQIIKLFDSLMRGYPIGSFLFWELRPENRDKWEVYKFMDHFRRGMSHNELASTDGIQQLTLVLDGQQRLTSMMIGLKGTYSIKGRYKRKENASAWTKASLYLDLLKDAREEDNEGEEEGIRYGFEFLEKPPKNDDKHFWFKVGHILDFDSQDRFDDFKIAERNNLPDAVTKGQMVVFEKNLGQLHRVIWKDDVISYYTEHDQDYDRVLDIFVRANDAGTKLSKSDLLLSMVTAKWGDINARQEIYNFVDHLNHNLDRKNDLEKDFVMKACLVLCDLPVQYKVNNFNNKNLDLIYQNWSKIKQTIERAIKLVNSFGIDRETLTSANALIPVIYYLFKHPSITLLTNSRFDVMNATRVRRWLTMSLLNNVFGGTSDNILTDIRGVLQQQPTEYIDFPDEPINATAAKSRRLAGFNDTAVENFLDITYGKQLTFLALSLLYDDNSWGATPFHQDHIFPQALFKKKNLDQLGLSPEKQEQYVELMDSIGNLELLTDKENITKSDQEFQVWIYSRDESFKRRHLIPEDKHLYTFGRFEEFIRQRQELIKSRLQTLFAPVQPRVNE